MNQNKLIRDLHTISIADYLEQLASKQPTPGGGSAAALTVAQGIALLSMVCNLTLNKSLFVAHTEEISRLLAIFESKRRQALTLAQQDIISFQQVLTAYRLPQETATEKIIKTNAIQQALKTAMEPPFTLMQMCSTLLPLTFTLEPIGNPSVSSDIIVGRQLLCIGLLAAKTNVDANLNLITDIVFCQLKHDAMHQMLIEHQAIFDGLYQLTH